MVTPWLGIPESANCTDLFTRADWQKGLQARGKVGGRASHSTERIIVTGYQLLQCMALLQHDLGARMMNTAM